MRLSGSVAGVQVGDNRSPSVAPREWHLAIVESQSV